MGVYRSRPEMIKLQAQIAYTVAPMKRGSAVRSRTDPAVEQLSGVHAPNVQVRPTGGDSGKKRESARIAKCLVI